MQLIKKYKNPSSKLTLRTDALDINGSSNPYADFAAKWQQATERGETSDPMEETRRRIQDRLNNNTFYWIDTDGSIKQDYLTDDAAVEDYRRKSGTATPLNWEFNLIAPARFGLGAIGNGIRTGLQAMNTAFTPSTWLNPFTGAKLLSPTVGTIADAGIQGAFAYEGLNGLWNQGRQGTLSSDLGSTAMHGLEVLPLAGPLGYAAKSVIGNKVKPFMDFIWNNGKVIQKDMPYNKNNYYREVSKEAIDDAITSGVIRSKNNGVYIGPYFGRGYTPWKRENYIIEGYPDKNDWISPMLYKNANSISQEDAEFGKYLLQDALQNSFFIDGPVGINAFPFYKGSINAAPTSNFTYWQKHPIIGWRQHFFNTSTKPKRIYSKPTIDITPVEGNITTSDIPNITPENASNMTPEQWTVAQDAAIAKALNISPEAAASLTKQQWDDAVAKGINTEEIQRLRDLSSDTRSGVLDNRVFAHSTPYKFTVFDKSYFGRTDDGFNGKGFYFTNTWIPENPTPSQVLMAGPHGEKPFMNYGKNKMYVYLKGDREFGVGDPNRNFFDEPNTVGITSKHLYDRNKGVEVIVGNPKHIKLADAVTFDDDGVRIGLGDRDNFSNPDVRWGLFPWIFGGGTAGYNYLNQDNTSSKYTNGGKLLKRKLW